jgi:putative phosphoribosyl transferase
MLSQPKAPFVSREEAGRNLATRLVKLHGIGNAMVLALPNGGVPVGREIARCLHLPLDVLLVEKIVAPGPGGKTLGAITGGGVRMLDWALIDRLSLSDAEVRSAVLRASMELARRESWFRNDRQSPKVADQTVILVDDGTTPCECLRNAVRLLRRQHAERVIVALPVACRHAVCDLRHEACELVTLAEPAHPATAGRWFRELPETSDAEAVAICRDAGRAPGDAGCLAGAS